MNQRLDLINNSSIALAIIQGSNYNKLSLKLSGNYSNANFKSEIRNNTLENNGTLLASFSFNITYDSIEDKTIVTPLLTAVETSNIPSTKYQGNGDINSRNAWLWDMEAHFNDSIEKIISLSYVQVIPEVTNGY